MIIKDWIAEAAKELASHFSFGSGRDSYVTDEQRQNVANNYALIIARHVPRCKTCRYWKPQTSLQVGECSYASSSGIERKLWAELYDAVLTDHDFGCVQWEANDGKT